jgi:hypothetical protein
MAEEQVLTIKAVLDDQATAGLAQLQRNIREMGGGPNMQAMEGMRRTGAEMTQSMQGASSALAGFGLAIPVVGAALAGMAASFVASGIGNFAEHIASLGRAARSTGTDLAQFRENISTLKTAGISEEEAVKQLQAFSDFQVRLVEGGNEAYASILNNMMQIPGQSLGAARAEMQQFLQQVAIAPQNEALQMVADKGKEIYERSKAFYLAQTQEAVASGAMSEQAAREHAERMARSAATAWAGEFGAPAIAEVQKAFRAVTDEEKALQAVREEQARKFNLATARVSSAWRDIKESMAAAVLTDDTIAAVEQFATTMREAMQTEEFQAGMRAIAAAVSFIARDIMKFITELGRLGGEIGSIYDNVIVPMQQFFEDPGQGLQDMIDYVKEQAQELLPDWLVDFFRDPGQGLQNALDDFARNVPRLAGVIEPMKAFFADPGAALNQAIETIGTSLNNLMPQDVKEFFAWTGEQLSAGIEAIKQSLLGLIPESVRDFFENPTWSGFFDLIERADQALNNLVPQAIREFFDDPKQGFYNLVNSILTVFENIGEAFKPVREFFAAPGAAFLDMVNQIKTAFSNLIPGPVRKLLGIGEEAAPVVAPPTPTAAQAAQSSIIVPMDIQGMQAAAANLPETPVPDVAGMQGGGPVQGGQPYMVGEGGPELMVPQQSGSVLPTALWGAGLAAQLAGFSGAGRVGHAVGRSITREAEGFGGVLRGVIPGMGALEAMHRDAQQGHPLRTRLRGALGIEDPGEPAPWQPGGRYDIASFSERFGDVADALDRSAAQQVNVSGVGKISVDVNAPPGTRVNAEAEGLFKTAEIMRQTQMLDADFGPVAATGVNAGTGTVGGGT